MKTKNLLMLGSVSFFFACSNLPEIFDRGPNPDADDGSGFKNKSEEGNTTIEFGQGGMGGTAQVSGDGDGDGPVMAHPKQRGGGEIK